MTRQQAELAIENAGLDVGAIEESPISRAGPCPRHARRGHARDGAIVGDTHRERGPASVDMPDLFGESYSRARTVLEQIGLRVGDVAVDSTSLAAGNTVIAQTPAAGQAVIAGSRVTLTVSGRP